MSIRVKPVEPTTNSGYHRSRMPAYVPPDPRYQVKRDNPKFQQILDEVQRMINTR